MTNIYTALYAWYHKENKALVLALDSIAGEFLEGEIDRSGRQFNVIWKLLKDDQKQLYIDSTVFESFANSLADKNNLKRPFELPDPNDYGPGRWKRIRPNPVRDKEGDKLIDDFADILYTI